MSYSAAKHEVLSDRIKNSMVSFYDVVNREMETIDDVYINETDSGGDVDFTDTENATKQEHVDAIVAMRAFQTTLAEKLSNITHWL